MERNPVCSLIAPVYVEGRRVRFRYVEYDAASRSARIGYDLVAMGDGGIRESMGETWHSFEEAPEVLAPPLLELARARLAELKDG